MSRVGGLQPRSCRAFSLLEMLSVLVIVGGLAGLSLTAMQHIGRATALSSGARQFADHITMARNYAVAYNTCVYLVVATSATTNAVEYPYSSYGFCVPVASNSVYSVMNTTNVVYVDDIYFLPKGVVFDSTAANVSTASISFPKDGSDVTTAWCVTITPNGQLLPPLSVRPTFTLLEGVVNSTTLQPMVTGVSSNRYQVEINPLIGKPIITKLP